MKNRAIGVILFVLVSILAASDLYSNNLFNDSLHEVTKTPMELEPDFSIEYQNYEVDTPPKIMNYADVTKEIKYPEHAKDSIEGKFFVKVLVDTNGNIIKVGGISGDEVFKETVMNTIYKLKFEPALIREYKVKCWAVIPFNFRLGK